jgi:2-enoate reductase
MKDLEVEVHFNHEIRSAEELPDVPLIIATGSAPITLRNVTGYEKMIEACDYLNGIKEVGQRVAVIGGGLTGCEIAYELYLQGKQPVIIEMKDDLVAQKGVCLANSSYLREYFAWKEVPVYLQTTLKEVQDGKIICTDKDGQEVEIAVDSVIGAVGYLPTPLSAQGRKEAYLVGDCQKVGNLRTVIWGAYEAAMKI